MIQHVWQRVKNAKTLDHILIACDDEKIFAKAKEFGADVVMTKSTHESGSDRIAEAVECLDYDIVVNIQGDEPLIESDVIDDLVRALKADTACVVATSIKVIKDDKDLNDPNVVKVTIDCHHHALYFSRSIIPYNRNKVKPAQTKYYRHLGLYAFRKNFLLQFRNWPKSILEKTEHLEQLRILEAGYKIKTVETHLDAIAVDTPEDLVRVEKILK